MYYISCSRNKTESISSLFKVKADLSDFILLNLLSLYQKYFGPLLDAIRKFRKFIDAGVKNWGVRHSDNRNQTFNLHRTIVPTRSGFIPYHVGGHDYYLLYLLAPHSLLKYVMTFVPVLECLVAIVSRKSVGVNEVRNYLVLVQKNN